MSVRQLNSLERFRIYRDALALPRFDNVEDAELGLPLQEGEQREFLLVRSPGAYSVCTAYLAQSRDNPPAWNYRSNFSFLHFDMINMKNRAALDIGLDLVESME